MNATIYRWTKNHELQTAQLNHMDQSIDWNTAAIVPNEKERFRMTMQGVLSDQLYIGTTNWNGSYINASFKSGLLNFKLFAYGSMEPDQCEWMLTVQHSSKHWISVQDGSLYDILYYIYRLSKKEWQSLPVTTQDLY